MLLTWVLCAVVNFVISCMAVTLFFGTGCPRTQKELIERARILSRALCSQSVFVPRQSSLPPPSFSKPDVGAGEYMTTPKEVLSSPQLQTACRICQTWRRSTRRWKRSIMSGLR